MARMYQQYERQQVVHISDPALRQQHPVSTISGISEKDSTQSRDKGVVITEVRDTSDQGTQVDAKGDNKSDKKEEVSIDTTVDDEEKRDENKEEKEELDEENADSDDKEKISQALGFESSVVEFINDVVDEVVSRVEGKIDAEDGNGQEKSEGTDKPSEMEKSVDERSASSQNEDGAQIVEPEEQRPSQAAGHHSPAEPQSAAEAEAEEKEANLIGRCNCIADSSLH